VTHPIAWTVRRMQVGERVTGLSAGEARKWAAEGWRQARAMREGRVYWRKGDTVRRAA
jgi:hypothetical protein